jgi:F-type H+-transporting ATPase subunit b
VLATIVSLLAQTEEKTNDAKDLYPHWEELIVGAVAFAILFYFMKKWVLPRINTLLEERRQKIQGELENAEHTRTEADGILQEYRAQLASAREESAGIIEEARRTAEQFRRDAEGRAEEESQAIVARAQDEIRAERDRVFQELRSQIGEISVELAARIVGQSLDESAHQRLIDQYIDEVAAGGNGQG